MSLAITVGVVMTIIPANTDFSAFSPTYRAVFLLAVLVVPVVIYVTGRRAAPSRRTPVCDGGIVVFKPRMQHSAMTFAAPVRVTFDRLYQPTVTVQRASDEPAGRSGPVHYAAEVTPLFQRAWWLMMITRCAPTMSVGSVTGIVAAASTLGSYFPPLVMGARFDRHRLHGRAAAVTTAPPAFGYPALRLQPRVFLMFVVALLKVGASLTAIPTGEKNAI